MTIFDKMKSSLDLVLDTEEMTVDDLAEFLSDALDRCDCTLCKWEEYCDHMMEMDDPDHEEKYPFGNGISCRDVIKSVLEKETNDE